MCKAYYAAFSCGHAVKLHISNCYPNFTCKNPERKEVGAPADLTCHQCGKVPALKLELPDASQESASKIQNLTSVSSGSKSTLKALSDTPSTSECAVVVVEPTTKVFLSDTSVADVTEDVKKIHLWRCKWDRW